MKKNEIFSVADAQAEGYKMAFVNVNRGINTKNVKGKRGSLKDCGGNLIPLMVVEATEEILADYTLLDAAHPENTLELVEGEKALIIIDGQHRYTAAIAEGINMDNIHCFLDYSGHSLAKLLAESNTESVPFSGNDYAQCAVALQPDNEVAKFAAMLSKRGFQLSTIGYILYRTKGALTKSGMASIMKGEEPKTGGATSNIELANYFLEKSAAFGDKFVAKRYLIQAVIDRGTEIGFKPACDILASLSADQIQVIKDAKSAEVAEKIKTALAVDAPAPIAEAAAA